MKLISTNELKNLINEGLGEKYIILDVRSENEFENGHIKNAININSMSTKFISNIKSLTKEKTYIIYCQTGGRAKFAYGIIQALGLNVILYKKGYSEWIINQ